MQTPAQPKKRGRPRQHPDRHGAPQLHVRLEKSVYEKVREQGGSAWVRKLIEKELGAVHPDFRPLRMGCMEGLGTPLSDAEFEAELRRLRTAWMDSTHSL